VEIFLGFANFYRHFIKNFGHIAKYLIELKGKKEYKWENEHQKVFKELMNKIKSLVNQYLLYLEEKENSEQKPIYQKMPQKESYLRNKKGNRSQLCFYQEQCKQLKETTRELLAIVKALTKLRQYLLNTIEKSGQIMKISSILENHINSIDNKQDGILSCKTMISFYSIFQGK